MNVELNTKINNIQLPGCVMNASGTVVSFEEMKEILDSESSAIVMKTCTVAPREGNKKPRYSELSLGSVQCMGLPNHGHKAYLQYASQLKNLKPTSIIIASIACSSIDASDALLMAEAFHKSKLVDFLEINISCPNIEGHPIGYSPEAIDKVLKKFALLKDLQLGLKLPPYPTTHHCIEIASVLKEYPTVKFVTCSNSLPGLIIEKGCTIIKPKEGIGGLGGEYLKPIALANVRTFYKYADGRYSIIGVGGVSSGIDVLNYFLAGADCVQIGTTLMQEGSKCFQRINLEIKEELKQNNYNTILEAKGKLKFL